MFSYNLFGTLLMDILFMAIFVVIKLCKFFFAVYIGFVHKCRITSWKNILHFEEMYALMFFYECCQIAPFRAGTSLHLCLAGYRAPVTTSICQLRVFANLLILSFWQRKKKSHYSFNLHLCCNEWGLVHFNISHVLPFLWIVYAA